MKRLLLITLIAAFVLSACGASATPVPELSVSLVADQRLRLSWPSGILAFLLKSTGSLLPPVAWQPVAAVPVLSNGYLQVTLPRGVTNQFFQLSLE